MIGTVRTSVDTNILSAIVNQEAHAPALTVLLADLSVDGPLVASAPVWVELAGLPYSTPTKVDQFLHDTGIRVDFDLIRPVWESAAAAYARYVDRRRRSSGGFPRRLVTDFLIGAHALVSADQLITTDVRFFGDSFPSLRIVPIPGTSTRPTPYTQS